MKKFALLVVLLLPIVSPVRAQQPSEDEPDLFYDIFIKDSCLTVWVDLHPLLNARTWDRLHDGVDFALECRIELNSPRWLWSDRLEAEQARTIHLSYHKVTGDFLLTTGDSGTARSYPLQEGIEAYLSDSVEICLAQVSTIDPDKNLKIALKITSIFLTDLNLADRVASGDGSDSPVKYLFRQFLELTDYGRRNYTTRSRPFSLSELPHSP
jgi:hypothetical protein